MIKETVYKRKIKRSVGKEASLENKLIDLYLLLDRWEKNHPEYNHDLEIKGDNLYITVYKTKANGNLPSL